MSRARTDNQRVPPDSASGAGSINAIGLIPRPVVPPVLRMSLTDRNGNHAGTELAIDDE